VVHPADDLRCHIARSPTGFFRVALLPLAGHSEVSDAQVPVLLEDQVFRLEVAVDDALGVDELQAQNDGCGNELCMGEGVLVCSSLKNS
jgi:hypothetical protein